MLFTLYPGEKTRALTFSYDDGFDFDRRLVGMLDEYGLRGTFNLISGRLDEAGYVPRREVAALYRNHEVAVHGVHHYDLTAVPPVMAVNEILDCRRALEDLVGYAVRGLAYPYGTWNDRLVSLLPSLGIAYARVCPLAGDFRIGRDLYRWQGSARNTAGLLETGRRFLDAEHARPDSPQLLYVWGHSFEFERQGNWDEMEEFCKQMAGRPDIWYATNGEIADYLEDLRRLHFTADCRRVSNPCCRDLWLNLDGQAIRVPAGGTVVL